MVKFPLVPALKLHVSAIAASLVAFSSFTHAQPIIGNGELVAPKIEITGGMLRFTIASSVAGRKYQLQLSDNLAAAVWQDLGDMVTGNGSDLSIATPHTPSTTSRFFRLKLDGISTIPAGFVLIPAGSFTMGTSPDEGAKLAPPEDALDELPVHTVTLDAFYLQKTEVTKTQWDEVRSWAVANGYGDLAPGEGDEADHPVNEVNWYDVIKWCNARSEKEGMAPVYTVSGAVFRTGSSEPTANWSANGYRLPTEAEWEKAARGGLHSKLFPLGDSMSTNQARYGGGGTVAVGSFAANGYGLHDMAGNVWEWCWDRYVYDYYGSSPAINPLGPPGGDGRCMRGGCWRDEVELVHRLRCANRGKDVSWEIFDDVGFRLARRSGS